MLYPQANPYRQTADLSGFWEILSDPDKSGEANGWASGFGGARPIAVPASWNEQFEDGRDFLGPSWYQTHFDLPWGWNEQRIYIRFGSVNYLAGVWLNGVKLGEHEGGHLPFEFEISGRVQPEGNLLVVRVDGDLAPDRVPPGNIPPDPQDGFPNLSYPSASFDFFPFCGIHRPVLIYTLPHDAISDVTVVTDIKGSNGVVSVRVDHAGDDQATARVTLSGHGASIEGQIEMAGVSGAAELTVADAALWAPGSPNLYDLTVELMRDGKAIDRYLLQIGIRTFAVQGDALLLNGKPVTLKGFCRHEDFPVVGRGILPALIVKDYALLGWAGANSFRTTHYPYSEQMMDMADRLGFLVIDEIPAVGLFFREEGLGRRLELCRQYIGEMIARDKNHPSVVMWSLANEPHSTRAAARPFFRNLYDLAKSMDATRPATIISHIGAKEESFAFLDVVCLNRYNGWYTQSGRIEEGTALLSAEMDALHKLYPKPMIITEFGADSVAGMHAQPPEMFSEEYQAELVLSYINMFMTKPYVAGYHMWNMCDFKTGQAVHRVGGMNLKGAFTRDRRPKLIAHKLRELWKK
jgi:beta-glucuronidase